MRAIVREIQVGGCNIYDSLEGACKAFAREDPPRKKINFTIELPNGECKSITIRDEDDITVAYGDFEGLPDSIEYAKDVCDKEGSVEIIERFDYGDGNVNKDGKNSETS